MRTILVTGGAGFVGSNFIRYFFERFSDVRIRNLDKLTYAGNLDNLKDIAANHSQRYEFMKGDIADKADIAKAAQGCDLIINFAAETHVDRSIMAPERFLQTDIVGVFNLLEYVRSHEGIRLLQISTDEVYGSIDNGYFSEDSAFQPNSPYSASKAGADLMCRAYHHTYGSAVIVTHSCNIYGPYQYPEKFIPLFVTNLLEGKKVPLYGKGMQMREWIFIEDYCRALAVIIERGEDGQVYNIGSGQEYRNIDTAKILLRLLGKRDGAIEFVPDRPGHDFRYALDFAKIRRLGWKPDTDFESGLKKTVDWYRDNSWWWKKIKSGKFLNYYRKQYKDL